ncbi:MAG: hypothetical protein DSZ33_04635 [Gammaproteobacteria bacterium]|nr:MAG: hypothetical protein DSZ33_04635 [Gammaproteobacteria bacterium]
MSAQELLHYLKTLEFGPWAASGIVVLFFLESAPFTGLFLPGIFLMVALGSIVQAGYVDFTDAILYASFGAILGDSVGYWLGRLGADSGIVARSLRKNSSKHARINQLLERYGTIAVFLGRFAWLVHPLVPLAAGVSRIKPVWFYLADTPAVIIWVLLYGAVGHFATGLARARTLEFFIGLGIVVVVALVVLLVRHFRHQQT